MSDTVVLAEDPRENSGYRFSWGLAFVGGIGATAVTFFLLTLGAGFGLLLVHPLTNSGPSAPAFLTGGAIYFFAAQAFGFAVGGHFAGRLLGPLVETRIQEDFRAAAHGFAAWAVAVIATLTVVIVAGMVAAGSGAAIAGLYGAGTPKGAPTGSTAYLVDKLFRPDAGAAVKSASSATDTDARARAEAGRLLDAGLARGEQMAPDDRDRLDVLVSQRAGISRAEADGRVDAMQRDVQAKTRKAADIARKAASYTSLWLAASLLFGALVSMAGAVFARIEDDRESVGARY